MSLGGALLLSKTAPSLKGHRFWCRITLIYLNALLGGGEETSFQVLCDM